MEAAVADKSSSPSKALKFAVYQNPAFSAALTAKSLRPSKSVFLFISFISTASAYVFLSFMSRENGFVDNLKLRNISQGAAYVFVKVSQTLAALAFAGAILAFMKALCLQKGRSNAGVPISPAKETKDQLSLTNHQLWLLGVKLKDEYGSESLKKPSRLKPHVISASSETLVPLHPSVTNLSQASRIDTDKSSGGGRNREFSTPSMSPGSPSLYPVPGASLQLPSVQNLSGSDRLVLTPWSNKRSSYTKNITTEEELEQFLAEVDKNITESAGKLATPPPTISSFGIATPNTILSSSSTSGNTRSAPLRPVKKSPGSQKFISPPMKGEGELPLPMSVEESIEAFECLGIYPQIELWRDRLRQWFSSVLLNPLLCKIETSHIQVMQAAGKLGISITINQIGSNVQVNGAFTLSPIDGNKDWQPTFAVDEDGLLHQLRAFLVQALDNSVSKIPSANLQPTPQQNPTITIIQECVDAITEHQRLCALIKGEMVRGLLPQISVRADYMVRRIRELAEGTCLKNYEYLGNGEVYDKANKKCTHELPTDSHLLLYLFCAFLEHPKWMLHVDSTSYAGVQSSKTPLFLGLLPPNERFSEKYIAVISSAPSILHSGAFILVVGKQGPPIFALYWDKKPQFSLQGRTALWDSILLLCHRIKISYGGIVRGLHLGSSALSILPVIESENED